MIDIIYQAYTNLVIGIVSIIIILMAIFGGEFSLKINWNSFNELIKHFKK